jgi:hypothetical protein
LADLSSAGLGAGTDRAWNHPGHAALFRGAPQRARSPNDDKSSEGVRKR